MRSSYSLFIPLRILILAAVVSTALLGTRPGIAQRLAEDSSRFAGYWELAEAGDSTAAANYLLSLTDSSDLRLSQMAGFLMGWLAYQRGDYAGVAVQLELGAPPELADHALFLQADALEKLGQSALATTLWKELARDTASVYAPEAFLRLAERARVGGNPEEFLDWAAKYRTRAADVPNRQRLDVTAAEILASQDRHEEAVEILYAALLSGPFTESVGPIRKLLNEYRRRYEISPRVLTGEEIGQELLAFENARAFQSGLHRVHEVMQSALGSELSELLTYMQARFESGLGRHRKAVESFQSHLRRFPDGRYSGLANYYLGRSAYLTDQDSVAVRALTNASNQDEDLSIAQQALELMGILYLDRGRPADAEAAFLRWETLSRGSRTELDCLWRLGWAQWECAQFESAAQTWRRLFELDTLSVYAPVSLYWQSRALQRSGRPSEGEELREVLRRRFPFSYYSVMESATQEVRDPVEVSLAVPALVDLWNTGGEHMKRFSMLTAMRLPELALKELPEARREVEGSVGMAWWEAQLQLWSGNRPAALRVIRRDLSAYIITAGDRPTDFFSTLYPLDFDPKIIELARLYEMDSYLAFALICQESHFNPAAISAAGATGLMQLMPETAKSEARKLGVPYTARKLTDPDYNLTLGMAHLAGLLELFSGNPAPALAAYNAGKNKANEWLAKFPGRERDEFIELIPYRETRMFVKRVLEHRAAYRRLYPEIEQSLLATPTHPQSAE